MGVGEDDRRWTIRVCEPCGELVTWCRCEWLPRQPEPPSVDVDVVPASVVVGLRGEVERLRDENRRFRTALGIPTLPPCSPDCEACEAESPVDALARVGQDVQPDGYATHTTCPACNGEGTSDRKMGFRVYVYRCSRCSGSGRVPTKEENE